MRGILKQRQHMHPMPGPQDPPAQQGFPLATPVFLAFRLLLATAAPAQSHQRIQEAADLYANSLSNTAICCCCACGSQPDSSSHSQWCHTAVPLGQTAAMLKTETKQVVLGQVCQSAGIFTKKHDSVTASQLLPGKATQTTHKCQHLRSCSNPLCTLRLRL